MYHSGRWQACLLGVAMRKLLPGSIAFAVLSFGLGLAPAMAGDLDVAMPPYKAAAPMPPPFSWGGFYVGGNLGGHFSRDEITTVTDPGFAGAAFVDAASTINMSSHGFVGGLQAGYNFAGIGGVWGVEVDVNWLGGTATRTLTGIPGLPAADALTNSAQLSFLSTYRMRWGIPFDRALVFVSGGFALGTLKTTDTFAQVGLPAQTISTSNFAPGLAFGGGADFAITPNLWVRGEYLFVLLKNTNATIPATAGNADDVAVTHEYSDNIFRLALNYKLSGSEP
jgi:outer membrane immunogenic protein